MTKSEQETANNIHCLKILHHEIGIEGEHQQATIARVLRPHIPDIIADLQELNKYRKNEEAAENGKATEPATVS